MKATAYLARLEKIKTVFEHGIESEKIKLLTIMQRRRFSNARQLKRLHDVVCFYYIYPDNKEVFQIAARILASFAGRSDLKNCKDQLINSGIAGTEIHFQFFWPMACWLAENWPANLQLLWDDIEQEDELIKILPLLVSPSESGVLNEFEFNTREWLHFLKSKDETDAVFFLKRLQNIYATDNEREALHDDLNLSYVVKAGIKTPNISNSTYNKNPVSFQNKPLNSARPVLKTALLDTRFKLKKQTPREGRILVDLARRTMLTHERDLDAFSYGNQGDVSLVDFGDGHQIACIGMVPARRYLLHTTYGFLNMRNGLPIGYFQIISVFNYADIAFNLFTPFRGAEASHIFARNLAIAHQVFEINSFNLDPYQLGYENIEGLKSGVWWFYYKLGFRPMDKEVRNTLNHELRSLKRSPGYRSKLATLDKLASGDMFYNLYDNSRDYNRLADIGYVLIGISDYLANRFGAAREQGLELCVKEAFSVTGNGPPGKMNGGKLEAWKRWSPLVMALGGVSKWSKAERDQLAEIISAKGHVRELEYLKRINRHECLKKRIFAFAARFSRE